MAFRSRAAAVAVSIVALVAAGCGSGAGPSNSPVAVAATLAVASPTLRPTPAATIVSGLASAQHIVSSLDVLAILFASGDGDATGQWANDEGTWVTTNMADLLKDTTLSDYPTNILALVSAVAAGQDQADAVLSLLAMRNTVAATFNLALATPEPTPQPTPVPKPVSYSKLTARNWAKIVKAPDNYIGKGYQLWACIWQFDAATGAGSFLGNASFKRQTYWNLYGESTSFTGDEGLLTDFVEDDIVVMNVISTGSYSYDTQAGGNTTVPSFEVRKIVRKGSCA
jgi:hypothetical protein